MKRKPLPKDPGELYRVHMHGAKVALAAAENSTGPIERELNLADARRHAAQALKLLAAK